MRPGPVTDHGATRIEVPAPAPVEDAAADRTVYSARTEAHALTVLLERGPCFAPSGRSLESKVTVELDGHRLTGCGMALH